MKILKSHRSIRQFLDRPVSEELLNSILECGIRASNTGNMQLYSVIVTRDFQKKQLLAPLHFNQPMVQKAPLLLTICLDVNRFSKWCTANLTKADFTNLLWLLNGTIDATIFAQNICIAAESSGLGICYLGTTLYNAPEIIQILNLPSGVIPITAISMGYPANIPELTDRLPLESIVHFEEYTDYSEEDIRKCYAEKESLEASKVFVAENGKDNLAQVYTEVRYKSSDSQYFSQKLVALLTEQGFLT